LNELKGAARGAALATDLDSIEVPERRKLLTGVIVDALIRTLQLPPDGVDKAREFGAMGLTSLLAMEFRNRLERALGRALPATLAWNYPTVRALAEHLAGGTETPAGSSKVTAIPPVQLRSKLGAVADMSDADALAALRGRQRSRAS
jgi:myxalamid-type polyketide synthase MxaE and MxaD